MKGLCWSRGTLGIHQISMLLLVTSVLVSSTGHSVPVRHAALPGVVTEEMVLFAPLGDQLSFNCTISSSSTSNTESSTGSNSSQLMWYDGPLLLNTTHHRHGVIVTGIGNATVTVTIPNVTSYHYGNYKCHNADGQVEASVSVMPLLSAVSTPQDLITEKLIDQRVGDMLISCDQGDMLVRVDEDFNHSVINDEVFVVNLSEHQGKYLCLGEDYYPNMIYYVRSSGYRPLNVTISPINDHQVPPYHNVDCLVTGAPGPVTINWHYRNTEGWPLLTGGRIHVERLINVDGYDGGLRLVLNSSFPYYDSGLYICVAKTNWEQREESVYINFNLGNEVYIAYWPMTTLAVGGSTINITCYAVATKVETELTFTFRKGNQTYSSVGSSKLTDYVTGASLQLHNVTQSDDGNYTCQLLHIVKSDWRIGSVVVYKDPLHVVSFLYNKSRDGHISLTCDITIHEDFSYRLADIIIVFKQEPNAIITPQLNFTANNIIAHAIVTQGGLYHCIATIDGVSKSLMVNIEVPQDKNDTSARVKIILLCSLAVVVLLCVVMCVLLFAICCRCPHKAGSYSNMVSKAKIGARLSTTSCASGDFVFKKSLSKSCLLMPSEWSISYDELVFDASLGSGAFGTVRKAYMMTGIGDRTMVAVKTLQCEDDVDGCKEAFEKEVMILHHVGAHQHIIGLFGVCVRDNRYHLVMELASQGSLLDYLHHKRTDRLHPLSVHEVLNFANQVALGMEHLAKQQCVHCDLAARNVLITGDFVLKISDFGLARQVYSGVYVKNKTKKVRLPIRWMAPESMIELKFSSESDMLGGLAVVCHNNIWSYGVLVWEIYQLGTVPYHGVGSHRLCWLLQQGLRLEKPENCSTHHYQLMLSCWHNDPSCRPSFTAILQDLSHLMSSTTIVYINWNEDADYYSDFSDDTSVTSSVENVCPVHGKSSEARGHPVVKRNLCLTRKDSGLPDSPNDAFACKKDLRCNESHCLLEETEV